MAGYTDEYVAELHRQIEGMRPVVRRLERELAEAREETRQQRHDRLLSVAEVDRLRADNTGLAKRLTVAQFENDRLRKEWNTAHAANEDLTRRHGDLAALRVRLGEAEGSRNELVELCVDLGNRGDETEEEQVKAWNRIDDWLTRHGCYDEEFVGAHSNTTPQAAPPKCDCIPAFADLHRTGCPAAPPAVTPGPGIGVLNDPAYSRECVCPFPRLKCPNCDEQCRACRYARNPSTSPATPEASKPVAWEVERRAELERELKTQWVSGEGQPAALSPKTEPGK